MEGKSAGGKPPPGVVKAAGVTTNWMGEHCRKMSQHRSAVKLAMGVQISNCPHPAVMCGPLGESCRCLRQSVRKFCATKSGGKVSSTKLVIQKQLPNSLRFKFLIPSKEFPEMEKPVHRYTTHPLGREKGEPEPSGLKNKDSPTVSHTRVRPFTNAWLPSVCPIQVIWSTPASGQCC